MPTHRWHTVDRTSPAALARKRQYNSREHKQRRAAGQRQVDAGTARCWRCGTWLAPGSTWHLGHDDNDRTIYRGTECVDCNLHAAAQAGARASNRDTPPPQPVSYPIATN